MILVACDIPLDRSRRVLQSFAWYFFEIQIFNLVGAFFEFSKNSVAREAFTLRLGSLVFLLIRYPIATMHLD